MLDQKLNDNNDLIRGEIDASNKSLKGEIVAEFGEFISEAFSVIEAKIDKLGEEVAKRPTKDEVFSWADRRNR